MAASTTAFLSKNHAPPGEGGQSGATLHILLRPEGQRLQVLDYGDRRVMVFEASDPHNLRLDEGLN